MRAGHNQYPISAGVPALREAIAAKVQRLYGHAYDPEREVTVTTGATQGLFTSIQALAHPGDEVILFEPAYDSYIPAIQLAGATPVPLPLQVPGYRIDWDAVRRALSPRTRMIVLNTPNNPGTSVLTARGRRDAGGGDARPAHRRDQRRSVRAHGVRRRGAPEPRAPRRTRRPQRGDRIVRQDVPRHRLEGGLHAGAARRSRRRSGACTSSPCSPSTVRRSMDSRRSCEDPSRYESLPPFFQRKRDLLRAALADTPFELLPCAGSYFQLARYDRLSTNRRRRSRSGWCASRRGDHPAVRVLSRRHRPSRDPLLLRQARRDAAGGCGAAVRLSALSAAPAARPDVRSPDAATVRGRGTGWRVRCATSSRVPA